MAVGSQAKEAKDFVRILREEHSSPLLVELLHLDDTHPKRLFIYREAVWSDDSAEDAPKVSMSMLKQFPMHLFQVVADGDVNLAVSLGR